MSPRNLACAAQNHRNLPQIGANWRKLAQIGANYRNGEMLQFAGILAGQAGRTREFQP
jgi:hypothetical protein